MASSDIDLFSLVHANEPSAAAPLYERFANGVRTILRHKLPDADLESGVFHVLVTVAQAIRQGQIQDSSHLTSEVRAVIDAFVASQPSPHKPPANESRRMLDELPPQEQEILRRFYHLGQDEDEIRHEMRIPRETVSSVRKTIRKRFLARPTD